jgi:hypothetical protein
MWIKSRKPLKSKYNVITSFEKESYTVPEGKYLFYDDQYGSYIYRGIRFVLIFTESEINELLSLQTIERAY